jgi:hypothetical protein
MPRVSQSDMSSFGSPDESLTVRKPGESTVGDGHLKGVATQTLEHMLRASGLVRVDHPSFPKRGLNQEATTWGRARSVTAQRSGAGCAGRRT